MRTEESPRCLSPRQRITGIIGITTAEKILQGRTHQLVIQYEMIMLENIYADKQ